MTLVERAAEWPKQWLREARKRGVAEGRKQGVAQGVDQQRKLLCRQAAARFDADTAARLADLLAPIADPERLAKIGEWLVRRGARPSALLASIPPHQPDTRSPSCPRAEPDAGRRVAGAAAPVAAGRGRVGAGPRVARRRNAGAVTRPGAPVPAPDTLEELVMVLRVYEAEWNERILPAAREQARPQGVAEGRAQGVDQQRKLLCRQAAARFDADTAARLAGVLVPIVNPERLADVGERLVRCETAAEFFARCDPV